MVDSVFRVGQTRLELSRPPCQCLILRDTVSCSSDEGDQVGGVCSWLRSSDSLTHECQAVGLNKSCNSESFFMTWLISATYVNISIFLKRPPLSTWVCCADENGLSSCLNCSHRYCMMKKHIFLCLLFVLCVGVRDPHVVIYWVQYRMRCSFEAFVTIAVLTAREKHCFLHQLKQMNFKLYLEWFFF